MKITNIETSIVGRKGLEATAWVSLEGGLSFKVLVLRSKQDGGLYIQFPSESYMGSDGQKHYRRLMSATDELYNMISNAVISTFQTEKGKAYQPVNDPEVLATSKKVKMANNQPPSSTNPQKAVEETFGDNPEKSDPNDILDDVIGEDIDSLMGTVLNE